MHPTTLLLLPLVGLVRCTDFLDPSSLLSSIEDPAWFEKNIPLLDIPDDQIQDVYYYRWQTYKEHLVYTGAQYGYLASEFLLPVTYGAPYGGVVAAAGHHINEGRWLRNIKYGQDIVNFWLAGPGQFPKPAIDGVNKDTDDWAHEYSYWAASSVWNQYLVSGDRGFVVGQLDNLVTQYRGWDTHFNEDKGLYWQVPVWDATEYTAASYATNPEDPYHGGAGFRPTINSYQYGDARAISEIAALAGDTSLAEEYASRAEHLATAMQDQLWGEDLEFFLHMARDENESGSLLAEREIMGYLPWMFNVDGISTDAAAFSHLKDPEAFSAPYGPTTLERRSQYFMKEASECCRWDGPSWPFATAQTLTAIENLLNNYPSQDVFTPSDYADALRVYAATLHKNGKPWVAEAHDPDSDNWMYDGPNHSEDYNHSTFIDNVIAGLLGLRVQADASLVVNPLAPSSWEYFAIEDVLYHGHDITVLWDSTGSHYNQGQGLRIWVDDELAGNRDTLGPLTVDVGSMSPPSTSQLVNIAANGQLFPDLSQPIASYTFEVDNATRILDGIVYRNGIPQNSRWTSYDSPNPEDFVGVDLRRSQEFCQVRLFFYDDAGGVRLPSSYDLQFWDGTNWLTVPDQQRGPAPETSNTETRITFPALRTSKIRVIAPNSDSGTGWGLSELEVWTSPIFQIRNNNSGKLIGVEGGSSDSGAGIQQFDDDGSQSHLWEFVAAPGGWWKLRNVNSGLVLSAGDGASLQQAEDSDTAGQLWRVQAHIPDFLGHPSISDGFFFVRSKASSQVAGVDGGSTENGADIVLLEDDSGGEEQLWTILPAVPEGRGCP